jgi:hypothetical protein
MKSVNITIKVREFDSCAGMNSYGARPKQAHENLLFDDVYGYKEIACSILTTDD